MDCEKFEPLLLDELYEELDELTSAAVKRHVASCARCGGILNDLRATRRGIALPIVALPDGLEDRILAAAKEATKVVPIKSRMSRALSVAGSWAMRPQTAMAAVFLLMIGTSAFLIRSKNYASSSPVSVTVEGAPSPTATQTFDGVALDDKAAAQAHGPSTPPNVTRPPMPAASVAASDDESAGVVDRMTGGAGREKAKAEESALGSALAQKDTANEGKNAPAAAPQPAATYAPEAMNAGGVAGAPMAKTVDRSDPWGSAGPSQTPAAAGKPMPQKRSGPGDWSNDPATLGAAAFRARNFADATRYYDQAAQTGDMNSALWAAESTKEGQGCTIALGRFVDVANRAAGSWVGSEASLRAARCQTSMGQLDAARDRLNKLAQVATHQQAAQQALAELNQVAARKAAGPGAVSGGAVAAPKRAASPKAPAPAPAEDKKVDRAVGY
jgi:hypothetical protein